MSSEKQQGFILILVCLILIILAGLAASFMFVRDKQGKVGVKSGLMSLLRHKEN